MLQREQLRDHEERVMRLEAELSEHRKQPPERGAKALNIQNYKEKDAYLNFEVSTQRGFLITASARILFLLLQEKRDYQF